MGEYLDYLGWLIFSISVLCAILGLFIYPQTENHNKYFIVYTVIGSILEVTSKVYAQIFKNNLVFFHINVLLDFVVLTLFFSEIFGISKLKTIQRVITPGVLLILINSIFVQNIYTYNSISLTALGIYIIGCSLYYFYRAIDLQVDNIYNTFTKYAVFSIFIIQFISTTVLFLSNSLLEIEKNNQLLIWLVRANIILMTKVLMLYQFIKIYKYITNLKISE